MPRKDITGEVFGRLKAICSTEERVYGNIVWECRCSCGNCVRTTASRLITGHTTSCGCKRKESVSQFNKDTKSKIIGGYTTASHPLYLTYRGMLNRCYWERHTYYKHYGGRGIEVCDSWRNSFENFVKDVGNKPEGHTLDRINPDGDYEPSNIRWATPLEQRHNRSTACE